MNLEEYLEKYGTSTLSLLVSKFIERAPSFMGDRELAAELGTHLADLESALRSLL